MPSSSLTLAELAELLSTTGATTLLVDGRSGAGKSTLADAVQTAWASSTVVRLDDIYPGWDGLNWAIEHVRADLLQPRALGRGGRWRRWDWHASVGAEWHHVGARQRVIVEGVGALAPELRALAGAGIWVDAPDDVRKRRALLRDGDTFRPNWDRWAAHEDAYLARCDPRGCADFVTADAGDGQAWQLIPTSPGSPIPTSLR